MEGGHALELIVFDHARFAVVDDEARQHQAEVTKALGKLTLALGVGVAEARRDVHADEAHAACRHSAQLHDVRQARASMKD